MTVTYLHKIVVFYVFDLPETDIRTTNILCKYVTHTYVLTYFTFAVVNAYLFKYFKYAKA